MTQGFPLRAEMKVPGRAWLQFETTPAQGGAKIRQTAIFNAAGLFGILYWYALYPFQRLPAGAGRVSSLGSQAPAGEPIDYAP